MFETHRIRCDCFLKFVSFVGHGGSRFAEHGEEAVIAAVNVPKTGDSGHPALWIGLAILGLVGILAAAARKVRKDPAARG